MSSGFKFIYLIFSVFLAWLVVLIFLTNFFPVSIIFSLLLFFIKISDGCLIITDFIPCKKDSVSLKFLFISEIFLCVFIFDEVVSFEEN